MNKFKSLLIAPILALSMLTVAPVSASASDNPIRWWENSAELSATVSYDAGHIYIEWVGWGNNFKSTGNEINVQSTMLPLGEKSTETIWNWGNGNGQAFFSPTWATTNGTVVTREFGSNEFNLSYHMDGQRQGGIVNNLEKNPNNVFESMTWEVNKDNLDRYVNGKHIQSTCTYKVTVTNPTANLKGLRFQWYSMGVSPEHTMNLYVDVADAAKNAAHQHSYTTFVSYVTAPTCTAAGVGTYKCSCGQTTTKSVAALGHATPGSWSSDVTNHYKNCTRCGTRLQTVAHVWTKTGGVAATCTAAGYNDYKCNTCGRTKRDTLGALGHSWAAEYNKYNPTCTDTGQRAHKCNRCGAVEVTSTIPALGHDWAAEYVSTQPTCTATGMKSHKCNRCGTIAQTTSVPALGHNYEWKWYSQDGVENAYKQQTCTRCGVTTGDKVYSTYTVTYITLDADNNIELARETAIKTFNDVVKGRDLGTSDAVFNNITYMYVGDTTATVRGDCTVYRNMRKKYYTVHYNANGGTGTMENTTWEFFTYYDLPTNAYTRTGYTFQGWSKSATGSVLYTDGANVRNVMVRTDPGDQVTLYAIWKANQYSVSFEGYPATNPADKTVTYDSTYGTLPTLSADGYVFKGWEYVPDDDTHTPITSDTIVHIADNHTLSAVWEENSVQVTYVSPSKSQVVTCLVGFKTTAPFTPTETGLIFKYWSTSQGGAEFDFNTPIKTNTTLYAVFESKKIDIILPGVDTITKDYPAQFGDLPVPVQPGKDFDGWYYDPDFKQPVNPTDNIPAEDTTLYPKYETSVYKLTLKDSSESWDMHYQDSMPALPTPKAQNKTFKYWTYENQAVREGDIYKWEKSIQLIPVYEDLKFNVVLPDGTTREVVAGDKIGTLPPAPDVAGKTPNGYVDQFGNPVTSDTIVEKDMVINHKYQNKNVTLTLIDGDWNTKLAQEAGVTFSGLPTRSKVGYFFSGWALYEEGRPTSGPVYQDTTLYAVYEADYQNIYLVDLNVTVQKKTGQPMGTLPDASKDGFDFDGWYDAQGNKITADTTVKGGGMDLHAKFTPINIDASDTVEIRYWSDGVKINTVDLPRGEILWDPGAPALKDVEARKFMFWSQREGGTKYDFGKRINTSLDLYAQWN